MVTVQLNDIGSVLRVTVRESSDQSAVAVSSATVTKDIILEKPDGTNVTKAASFTTDGTDGKIQYATISGDMDAAGTWGLQASVVLTSHTIKSTRVRFEVKENL